MIKSYLKSTIQFVNLSIIVFYLMGIMMCANTIVSPKELWLKTKSWHRLSPFIKQGDNLVVWNGEAEYVIMSMDKYKYHIAKDKADFYRKDIREAKKNWPYMTWEEAIDFLQNLMQADV